MFARGYDYTASLQRHFMVRYVGKHNFRVRVFKTLMTLCYVRHMVGVKR